MGLWVGMIGEIKFKMMTSSIMLLEEEKIFEKSRVIIKIEKNLYKLALEIIKN